MIAVTGNMLETDVEACRQVGMSGFIEKPIKVNKLKTALERCCSLMREEDRPETKNYSS